VSFNRAVKLEEIRSEGNCWACREANREALPPECTRVRSNKSADLEVEGFEGEVEHCWRI
jgi:hypothetical protein